VPAFEELIRQGLLEEKFRKLVTDGISVGPAELQDEFRYKNEKVKLDYALIKPKTWKARFRPDEAEIRAAYEKNSRIPGNPERRVARYALVDVNQIRQNVQISQTYSKLQYQPIFGSIKCRPRSRRSTFSSWTVGKPDAEVRGITGKRPRTF